jgi:hypothetical protein
MAIRSQDPKSLENHIAAKLKGAFEKFRGEHERKIRQENAEWGDLEEQRLIEKDIRKQVIQINFETLR